MRTGAKPTSKIPHGTVLIEKADGLMFCMGESNNAFNDQIKIFGLKALPAATTRFIQAVKMGQVQRIAYLPDQMRHIPLLDGVI